jgi:hypothetical protein
VPTALNALARLLSALMLLALALGLPAALALAVNGAIVVHAAATALAPGEAGDAHPAERPGARRAAP